MFDKQIVPALSDSVVDTTAAGDAFAGAIAVRWAETNDLQESIRFASAAGALAVSRIGAQPSLPVRSEILQLLPRRILENCRCGRGSEPSINALGG